MTFQNDETNSSTIKSNGSELWPLSVKESEFLEALGLSMSFEEFEPTMKRTAYVDKFSQIHSITLIEYFMKEQTPTFRKQETAEVLNIALSLQVYFLKAVISD